MRGVRGDAHKVGDDPRERGRNEDAEKKVDLDEPAAHLPLELPTRILKLIRAVGEYGRLVVDVLDPVKGRVGLSPRKTRTQCKALARPHRSVFRRASSMFFCITPVTASTLPCGPGEGVG